MRRFSCLVGLVVVLGAVNASGAAASGWSLQRTPNRPGVGQNSLIGVSCVAKNFCIAVGGYSRGNTSGTLAERWDGNKWSLQRTPKTPGTLSGVSCIAKSFCIAVGGYSRGGAFLTLAERWDGTRWSLQRTANPPGAREALLAGVSCTGKNACEAVGGNGYNSVPLAERWDGTRWSLQRAPNPPGPQGSDSSLGSVSCTAKNACVAVGTDGYSNRTSDGMQTLAERWNGTRWSLQRTANPVTNYHDSSTNGDNELTGVSCTAMNACIAVGFYQYTTCYPSICQATSTLAEHWDGTRWSLQQAPGVGTNGVSCAAKNACTAVGDSRDALRWNGTKWSLQRTATPTGANVGVLLGVSCPAKNACIAVGAHNHGSPYDGRTLAERWNGG